MDKSKIEKLDPQEYTHLPHAEQHFEDHEQTDVAIRPLVWTLVALAAVLVVTGIGMWGLFEVFEHVAADAPDNQPLSQVERIGVRQVPEGYPAIQGITARGGNPNSAARDMDEMRNRNTLVVAGQAPMRSGMQPGMPIEQAIDEALARGIFKTGPRGGSSGGGGAATQPGGHGSRQQQEQKPTGAGQSR